MPSVDLHLCRLYGFVDTAYLAGRKAVDVARMLVEGGADIIQLRAKAESREQIVAMARAILPITRPARVPLIVNDYPDIAREVGADGVHLGQEDLMEHDFVQVRKSLDPGKIIGISTHSLEQALVAEQLGADYIGVGPIFPTGTKPGRPAVGLELVRQVAALVNVPFVSIGGITLSNVRQVTEAGCRWVAVVSAILCASDATAQARALKRALAEPTV
jgi:thiamine-phosphate pyrophosphorylase